MRFGERLKRKRQENKLTQQQVADEFHVSRQTISSWETEHSYPDIESLIRLSDYYQVSLDTLLKEDKGMTEYLQKQEVLKRIKPIIWILSIIDVIFMIFAVASLFGFVEIGSTLGILIYVMGMLNIFAMQLLSRLRNKVSDKVKKYESFYKSMYWIIPITIILVGICYFMNQWRFFGFFTGIVAALLAMVISIKLSENKQKRISK